MSHEDKDGSTKEEIDPWNPPYPTCPPGPPVADLNVHIKLANEWLEQRTGYICYLESNQDNYPRPYS
jgi:hypothetical protein